MSTIAVPEISMVPIFLEARELLGDSPQDVAEEPGRISFGRAEPVAVTPATAGIDDALRASLADDADHRYFVLAFTCSFRPDDNPLVESRVVVRLTAERSEDGDDPPIARSLEPDRLVKPIERTIGFSLTPKVTFAGVDVEGGGITRQDTIDVQEFYLVATGKGEGTAEWFFRATEAVALEGMHDLRLIAQVRLGAGARAEVKMTAKIRRRAAGIVPYRAALPERLRTIPLPA